MAKEKNEIQLQAKESAKWLLSQAAVKKDGNPIVLYDKPLNNMDVLLAGLLQSGSQGAVAAAMNLLTISGVLGDEVEEITPEVKEQREQAKRKYRSQLSSIKTYITKKLKAAEVYDNTITYAIEIAAVNILLYRKLADEVLPEYQSLVDIETSREGAARKKASPLLGELQRQMERTLIALRDLSMTVKSGQPKTEDDAFSKFMEEFRNNE